MSQLDQNQIRGLADTLNGKVDKENGKGLSDENFTSVKDQKLSALPAIRSLGANLYLDPTTGELSATGAGGQGVNLYNELGQHTDGTANQKVVTDALAGKEPVVTAGNSTQYYRGDKTWQTLDKAAAGLGNVDNTSDAAKKTAFTGEITAGSTGFVTGDDVNTALAGKASTADMTQAQTDINTVLTGVRENRTEINAIKADYVKVVTSTTDIGEGSDLAANTLYAVYS